MEKSISDKLSDLRRKGYFSYLAAVLAMIIIPVHYWYFPPVMILWCLGWLYENYDKPVRLSELDNNAKWLFLLFILLYLWQIIGITYSEDVRNGIEFNIMRLPFFIFPFLMLRPGKMIRQNQGKLLRLFALSGFAFLLFCFTRAGVRSIDIINGEVLFKPYPAHRYWDNYFFSAGGLCLNMHPSYLGMYILFAIFIAFDSAFRAGLKRISRAFWFFIGILLTISLYFISSRACLITLLILLPVFIFIKLRNKIGVTRSLVIILLIFIALIPIVNNNYRVKFVTNKIQDYSVHKALFDNERGYLWKSAITIIKKNFIFGVGTGDVKKELIRNYNQVNNVEKLNYSYNAHNQYLETILENGIIGFILFIAILGLMLYSSISQKKIIYSLFVAICLILFLFESMLSRLGGIVFFALFSFMLNNNTEKIVK